MSAQFPRAFSDIGTEIHLAFHASRSTYIEKFKRSYIIPQFCQVSHSTLQLKASEHCIALEDQLLAAGPT